MTHPPIRSATCCFLYLKIAELIIAGKDKNTAYQEARNTLQKLWQLIDYPENEKVHFSRFIQGDIRTVPKGNLKSGGYVIETIEAILWAFLSFDSYESIVLNVINLGHDTDTTGAIVGGLAALYYGSDSIPKHWLERLARKEDIIKVGMNLHAKYLL